MTTPPRCVQAYGGTQSCREAQGRRYQLHSTLAHRLRGTTRSARYRGKEQDTEPVPSTVTASSCSVTGRVLATAEFSRAEVVEAFHDAKRRWERGTIHSKVGELYRHACNALQALSGKAGEQNRHQTAHDAKTMYRSAIRVSDALCCQTCLLRRFWPRLECICAAVQGTGWTSRPARGTRPGGS